MPLSASCCSPVYLNIVSPVPDCECSAPNTSYVYDATPFRLLAVRLALERGHRRGGSLALLVAYPYGVEP
jgi:hypothetical protein